MRCIQPKLIWPHRSIDWCDRNEESPVSVPCGKCLACLSSKRNDWSFRLEQEFKYSRNGAVFVTLTYDQKHLPSDLSVNKRDVQLFLKRLRKRYDANQIRYYIVGEYGSKYGRPHYHALLFGADSEKVRKSWVDSRAAPIGIVHVGKVTSASVAYVTKYIIQQGNEVDGRTKPFTLMSRAYGIGGKYLTDVMCAWHREDDRNYCVRDGQKIRMPKFYKDKIFYNEKQKERISKASRLQAIKQIEDERRYYVDQYGEGWSQKMIEARNEVISRIKQKVSYTQTF